MHRICMKRIIQNEIKIELNEIELNQIAILQQYFHINFRNVATNFINNIIVPIQHISSKGTILGHVLNVLRNPLECLYRLYIYIYIYIYILINVSKTHVIVDFFSYILEIIDFKYKI